MSKQDARKFLDSLEQDPKLRDQIINAESPQEKKQVIHDLQLNFTGEEYQEAINEKWHTQLSPEEMQKIVAAGGQGPCSNPQTMKAITSARPAFSEE